MTTSSQSVNSRGMAGDDTGRGKPLRYHLRFQIMPGENVERDTRALADFCTAHGVEEVVLFYAGEEWNNGLLSPDEEDLWFDIVGRAKQILGAAGIVVSLNPCATLTRKPLAEPTPAPAQIAEAGSETTVTVECEMPYMACLVLEW